MSLYDDSHHGVCTIELNEDLQQASRDLLSAHRTTHRLRIRYSSADLARFGRAETLRDSARAASALHEFYSSIEKQIPVVSPIPPAVPPSSALINQATGWVSNYLQQQREYYAPVASALPLQFTTRLRPYFSLELLERVRFVELRGARVSIPDFFEKVRAYGFEPPAVTHMDSLTFVDVVVFNHELSDRALFHALVHAVQIEALGLDRYAELWVRAFLRTRAHFIVPIEVHAFSLSSRFLRAFESFSVEQEVLDWINNGRY